MYSCLFGYASLAHASCSLIAKFTQCRVYLSQEKCFLCVGITGNQEKCFLSVGITGNQEKYFLCVGITGNQEKCFLCVGITGDPSCRIL